VWPTKPVWRFWRTEKPVIAAEVELVSKMCTVMHGVEHTKFSKMCTVMHGVEHTKFSKMCTVMHSVEHTKFSKMCTVMHGVEHTKFSKMPECLIEIRSLGSVGIVSELGVREV
jgi:hypothetical protein